MSLLNPDPPPFLHRFDRARYAPGWLAIERDEEEIVQPLVLGALRALGGWYEVLDSGARDLRGRAFGALRRGGASGSEIARVMRGETGAGRKGTPDIVGCTRTGRFVAIECKRPAMIREGRIEKRAGEPSREQIGWLLGAHRFGALVGIAWGPSDVEVIVTIPQATERLREREGR